MYKHFIKPLFDVCFSGIAFVCLLPIFLIITVLLALANHGKPFFTQKRIGKNNRIFKVYKFKTMNDARDKAGVLLGDFERLTPVGKFVRKTSLDEIPQLINILKGDMSFIGPRPLLPEYLPLYNSEQLRRHTVTPGISGWAQINGRNSISWQEKFKFDIWYVENQSFLLDLKIFFLTFYRVLVPQGVNSEKAATMEKFNGSN
jgi:lipopolysaccharide/colanic/teichoic acid biosynthesis glycosyltransferase